MTTLITVCRSARVTPAAYHFYCAILRAFPEGGAPPAAAQLAALAERFAVPLASTLADLAAQDLVQIEAATGQVRAAYPFSGVPTVHHVTLPPSRDGGEHQLANQQVFAMCALDALGIPLMLHRTGIIVSQDALTHEAIQVSLAPTSEATEATPTTLDDWRAVWNPQCTVVYARDAAHEHEHDAGCAADGVCCPVTNFFTDIAHAERWAQLHPVADGVVLSQVDALTRAQALFGGVLHRQKEQRK